MKILIIRFSSMGDIVAITPIIRAAKHAPKVSEVHVVTKARFKELLDQNPYIDKLWLLEDSLFALIGLLRKEKFDAVIDLHNNLRTFLMRLTLWTKWSSVNKQRIRKWLFTKFKWKVLPKTHIVSRHFRAAAKFGIRDDGAGYDFFIHDKDEIRISLWPSFFQRGYVAMAIGGTHYTKRLPTARLIELCGLIGRPIVLLGGPNEFDTGEKIRNFFNDRMLQENRQALEQGDYTFIYNACGQFSLSRSASAIKNAQCVFTHDTGMMHIASAFRKELYVIWGSTSPTLGMEPFRTPYTSIEKTDLACHPCTKMGRSRCPRGHMDCLNKVDFGPALEAFKHLP